MNNKEIQEVFDLYLSRLMAVVIGFVVIIISITLYYFNCQNDVYLVPVGPSVGIILVSFPYLVIYKKKYDEAKIFKNDVNKYL